MRSILILVLLSLSAVTSQAQEPASRPPRIRGVSSEATALLVDATRRSPTVAALADALGRTDVIVYVTQSVALDFPPAYMAFLGQGPGIRYLLIRINPWLACPAVRIAWLAHELQHALEVAGAPEVRDEASLGVFYRRIGWEVSSGRFESDAAVAAERRASEEVTRQGRQALPE